MVLADPAVRVDVFRVLSFSTDIARGLVSIINITEIHTIAYARTRN